MSVGHSGPAMCLAFSLHRPDLLFTGGSDGMMKAIWTESRISQNFYGHQVRAQAGLRAAAKPVYPDLPR